MIDPRIKIRHLQCFVEVARLKSVNKAAAVLNITQPAVTKTMRELEEALSVALFDREGRSTKLTTLGEVFLQHASQTLTALALGLDAVVEAQGAGEAVRIGALPTVCARIMPFAMQTFLAHKMAARVKIVTGDNAVLIEQLRLGELDVMVGRLASAEKMAGLSFEHLYSEQVVLVVRPGHPLLAEPDVILKKLPNYLVLMPNQNSIIRPFVDRLLLTWQLTHWPNQIETVSDVFGRSFIPGSDAVWIISEGVVAEDLASGKLMRLAVETSDTKGPVGITLRAGLVPSLAQNLLIQAIREAAKTVSLSQ